MMSHFIISFHFLVPRALQRYDSGRSNDSRMILRLIHTSNSHPIPPPCHLPLFAVCKVPHISDPSKRTAWNFYCNMIGQTPVDPWTMIKQSRAIYIIVLSHRQYHRSVTVLLLLLLDVGNTKSPVSGTTQT